MRHLPDTMAKINLIITSGLYFITTLSLEEIIAICITDKIQNNPKHVQLIAANIPLIYTPTENRLYCLYFILCKKLKQF